MKGSMNAAQVVQTLPRLPILGQIDGNRAPTIFVIERVQKRQARTQVIPRDQQPRNFHEADLMPDKFSCRQIKPPNPHNHPTNLFRVAKDATGKMRRRIWVPSMGRFIGPVITRSIRERVLGLNRARRSQYEKVCQTPELN